MFDGHFISLPRVISCQHQSLSEFIAVIIHNFVLLSRHFGCLRGYPQEMPRQPWIHFAKQFIRPAPGVCSQGRRSQTQTGSDSYCKRINPLYDVARWCARTTIFFHKIELACILWIHLDYISTNYTIQLSLCAL